MLADTPNPDRFRQALNVTARDGRLRTRRGWSQLIADATVNAEPWGPRLLVVTEAGDLAVFDGALHTIGSAGALLAASTYAALTDEAARERRLYFSTGNGLQHVALSGGAYSVATPTNACTDAAGNPYPIPAPAALATWRSRLWVSDGTNRIAHSDANAPH